jgi:hypothetical protein
MGVYDRQIAQAKRTIKAKGELCQWVSNSNLTPNPSQPWKTTAPSPLPTNPQVYIVFLTPGTKLGALIHLLQGTSVPEGGPSGLMAQVPFQPAIDDSIIRSSGQTFTIKDLNIVSPNGEVILYKLDFA